MTSGTTSGILATFCILLLGFTGPVRAGDLGTVTLDRDSLTVGDPITVTIQFTAPADYRLGTLHWPYPRDTLVPLDTPRVEGPDDSLWTVRARVALFVTGRLPAGPDDLLLFGPDGDSTYVAFPPESVTVASVLPAGQDSVPAADYKALIAPPGRIPVWLWATIALLAIAAVVAYRWWKRPRATDSIALGPARPPWEEAIDALNALEARGHHARGEPRPFAIELSEITRRYLEGRFGFEALEQTTREIRAAMQHTSMQDAQRDPLLRTLADCDLAKYAKFHWPAPELVTALRTVRTFVDQTTPRVEEETTAV